MASRGIAQWLPPLGSRFVPEPIWRVGCSSKVAPPRSGRPRFPRPRRFRKSSSPTHVRRCNWEKEEKWAKRADILSKEDFAPRLETEPLKMRLKFTIGSQFSIFPVPNTRFRLLWWMPGVNIFCWRHKVPVTFVAVHYLLLPNDQARPIKLDSIPARSASPFSCTTTAVESAVFSSGLEVRWLSIASTCSASKNCSGNKL